VANPGSSTIVNSDGTFVFETFYFAYDEYRPPNYVFRGEPCVLAHGLFLRVLPPPPPPPPPVTCPIPDLDPLPAGDACTASLEANKGLVNPAVCTTPIPVLTAVGGHPCWSGKLDANGIAYGGPTSTLRTPAYDRHLLNVWQLYKQHEVLFAERATAPELVQACAARRAAVQAEMNNWHGLRKAPVITPNSTHQQGRAFDVSDSVIDAVYNTTAEGAGFLVNTASPSSPACTLRWGGDFRGDPDWWHFDLR
jgi:hypothetical protein